MFKYFFEFIFPLIFISLTICVSIAHYKKQREWRDKFKEGTRVYTSKEEDGVIICIKNDKAFVKFFHGNYWRDLDDLIPYNKYLD